MMRTKNIIFILLILGFSTCIKSYDPNINKSTIQNYVVQGTISNEEGWQEVNISLSSPASKPEYIPVNSCEVEIKDELGQIFKLDGYEDGKYRVWMSSEYLVTERSYMLKIKTPDGQILESAFDKMPKGPEIEDVYFELEDVPTNEPDVFLHGIHFYIDLKAGGEDSRFYKWQLTETWEYHSAYPNEFYYDGEVHQNIPPDSSQYVCWATEDIPKIYTLSTKNLVENSFNRFPLHYVRNTTEQLAILYSVLVKQIALSEEAFTYWDQLRMNSDNAGGLYSTQPLPIQGNIVNTTSPDQKVLGFFQASSISAKRLFVEPVPGLVLEYSDHCSPTLMRKGLIEIRPQDYPGYLMSHEGRWTMVLMNDECVECKQRGGTTTKPDFWP